MIFSAFAILNFTTTAEKSKQTINNPSVPVVSYTQFGETVSFIGSQPVISFGSTEYPVSWNILNIEQPSHLSANPLHATGNNSNSAPMLSLNSFNSYRTSRINNTLQNSVNLIKCGNSTRSASLFSFHNSSMSLSLAFENKLSVNATYMIDFTTIIPMNNSYQVSGNDGVHNLTMKGVKDMIPSSCNNIYAGGIDINWQSEMPLYHGGAIIQKDHQNVLVIPFGPVTLMPNETYTIDPQVYPDRIPTGGSGSAYAPNSKTCRVYNSNGEVAGTYTLSSYTGSSCPNLNVYSESSSLYLDLATGMTYQHSDGTWCIKQELSYGYSIGNYGGSLFIDTAQAARQNPKANALTDGIVQYLFQIVSAAIGFPIPDPLSFISTCSNQHCSTSPFETTSRGALTSYSCGVTRCYNPIWQSCNPLSSSFGKTSYMFGIQTDDGHFNYGTLNNGETTQFIVCYSVDVTFLGGSGTNPAFYGGSAVLGTEFNVCNPN